jgi:rare lipoprotein A
MRIANSAVLWTLVGVACFGRPMEADATRHHRTVPHAEARHHHGSETVREVRNMQSGVASVYSERFRGRRMADGTRFDPGSNAAASKTLPLGTTAQVTNLENGHSATVQIRDRGPHRRGRIIDLSPGSAASLGMNRHSTAPVAVAPLSPPPDR